MIGDHPKTPADIKELANELRAIAARRGVPTCIIAISHPTAGWYVAIEQSGSFEALGLAHQAVRSVEAAIDRGKKLAGTEGDV
jgi:hypothetical protein